MSDRDAFFAIIDHFNQQHWHDRNRYHERIKALEAANADLKVRLTAQETPGA